MKKTERFATKLEILNSEVSVIYSHLAHLRSLIWNVKKISLTLWLISAGVGFGAFTSGVEPIFVVLVISFILPMWFIRMESIYSAQYRQHLLRLREIQKFMAGGEYRLPNTEETLSFEQSMRKENFGSFPIPDYTGEMTFANDSSYYWHTSKIKRSIGTSRTLFYGGQSTISSILIAITLVEKYQEPWMWIVAFGGFLWVLMLRIAAAIRKRRYLKSPSLHYNKWWGT